MKSHYESYSGRNTLPELKNYIGNHIAPNHREWEKNARFPENVLKDLHSMGLWNMTVPAEFGGDEATTLALAEVMRELGYGCSALATAFTASFMAGLCIFLGANDQLRRTYARSITQNGEWSAFAMTEKEGGSDLSNIQTTARVVEGGYILNGDKCFVTNAPDAKHFVVVARLEHVRRSSRGLSLFYVPGGSDGLQIDAPHKKFGQNAVRTCPISLRDVFVPTEHRIGEEGTAREFSYRVLQRSRCLLAAGAIGLCSRAGEVGMDYLSKRIILRRSLLSQPVIRNLFTQIETEKEAAWQLIMSAAKDWDDNAPSLHRINMAKLFAGQVANRYAAAVMELFGGWSYTDAYEIEQLVRDAKFYEAVEGPAFVQQILIARGVFPSKRDDDDDTPA